MPKITLNACEVDESGALTDQRAEKVIDWPTVPRKGESLWVGGNNHEVDEVWHWIEETPDRIQVDFICDHDELTSILNSPGWKLREK